MSSQQYTAITEKIVNNSQTNFMILNEVQMEQKKYVSKLSFGNNHGNSDSESLTIQLPECQTKAGIVEQASKIYTDLMFDSTTEGVKELVDMIIAMEEESAKQLYARSGEWFDGDTDKMTLQSFEDMFSPVVRYVNRQQNVCVRVHIPTTSKGIKQIQTKDGSSYDCEVYDKNGKTRLLSDIRNDTQLLPLVEMKELRISATSIALHVNMVECMIVKDSPSLADSEAPSAPVRRIQLISSSSVDDESKHIFQTKQEREVINNSGKVSVTQEIINNKDNNVVDVNSVSKVNDDVDVNVADVNDADVNDADVNNADVNDADVNNADVNNADVNNADVNDDVNDANVNDADVNDGDSNSNIEDVSDKLFISDDTTIESKNDEGLIEVDDWDVDEAETIRLKKPDEVYKEIYKAAISKAKKLRQVALEAYLDAKKIKAKFLLEDIYDSDDDGDEDEDDAELEEVKNLS